MSILVTGALGFIGSNLVPKLLKAGHNVVGFDNMSNTGANVTDRMKAESEGLWRNFKFYKIDIRDVNQMQNILANEKVEAIAHLAAVGSVPRSYDTPIDTVSVNEAGFVNVCFLAGLLKIKRIIFASSSSVKKDDEKKHSPYSFSKKQNEIFAQIWCPQANINYVGLRFHNVYGPGQREDSAYAAVIPRFISMKKPVVYGDGFQSRDFTFVNDVTEAIRLAITYSEEHSGIYDIGTGMETNLNEILGMLDKSATYLPSKIGDVKSSCAVTMPAYSDFNFKSEWGIKYGLEATKKHFEDKKQKRAQQASP